jgi:hypothetical protein
LPDTIEIFYEYTRMLGDVLLGKKIPRFRHVEYSTDEENVTYRGDNVLLILMMFFAFRFDAAGAGGITVSGAGCGLEEGAGGFVDTVVLACDRVVLEGELSDGVLLLGIVSSKEVSGGLHGRGSCEVPSTEVVPFESGGKILDCGMLRVALKEYEMVSTGKQKTHRWLIC